LKTHKNIKLNRCSQCYCLLPTLSISLTVIDKNRKVLNVTDRRKDKITARRKMHHILCGCFDGNEKHNNKNIKKYFKNIKNIFKTFIKNIC